jgi:hypothetical protein
VFGQHGFEGRPVGNAQLAFESQQVALAPEQVGVGLGTGGELAGCRKEEDRQRSREQDGEQGHAPHGSPTSTVHCDRSPPGAASGPSTLTSG